MNNTGELNSIVWHYHNLNTGSTIDYMHYMYVIGLLIIVIVFTGLIWVNRKDLINILGN